MRKVAPDVGKKTARDKPKGKGQKLEWQERPRGGLQKENKLPEDIFVTSKRMLSVFKCSHHLSQFENDKTPKLISHKADLLKTFPKPFAPNDKVQGRFSEIADTWCHNLCKAFTEHYHETLNSHLKFLENNCRLDEGGWQRCIDQSLTWPKSHHKKLSNKVVAESLSLIDLARQKGLSRQSSVDLDEAHEGLRRSIPPLSPHSPTRDFSEAGGFPSPVTRTFVLRTLFLLEPWEVRHLLV